MISDVVQHIRLRIPRQAKKVVSCVLLQMSLIADFLYFCLFFFSIFMLGKEIKIR